MTFTPKKINRTAVVIFNKFVLVKFCRLFLLNGNPMNFKCSVPRSLHKLYWWTRT